MKTRSSALALGLAATGLACAAALASGPTTDRLPLEAVGDQAGGYPPSATPVALAPVDQLVGDMRGVASRGDVAFAGQGMRLAAWDFGDPARPRALGLGPLLAGVVQDVAIRDGVAYVAAGDHLYALDVLDPSAIRLLAGRRLGQGARPMRLLLEGDLLLAWEEGYFVDTWLLWIFDLSDPGGIEAQAPGRLVLDVLIQAAALGEGLLFLGLGDRLNNMATSIQSFDIRDPQAPTFLSRLRLPTTPQGMVRIGRQLVVATHYYEDGSFLITYDHSPAGNLVELARAPIDVDFVQHLARAGEGLLLFADYELLPFRLDGAGQARSSGPRFEDPRLVNAVISDFQVDGERLFVATGNEAGLLVADIADPARLAILGQQSAIEMVSEVAVTDRHILFSSSHGLVDRPIWTAPRQGGDRLARPAEIQGITGADFDVEPALDRLWAPSGASLKAYDIRDPAAPRLLGQADLESSGSGVDLWGDLALVSRLEWDEDVVYAVGELWSVADPAAMRRVAELEYNHLVGSGRPREGDRFYLPERERIRVLDIGDPTRPTEIGSIDGNFGSGVAVVAQEGRLYLATRRGFAALDVRDPGRPRLLRQWAWGDDGGYLTGMEPVGEDLLVLREQRLDLVDLFDPDRPLRVASGEAGWIGRDLAIHERRAYIADTVAGVTIWDIPDLFPGRWAPVDTLYLPHAQHTLP